MALQKLSQTQKMLQKLSPQQILLMKLLQVTTMELSSRIKEEIEENPALEEGKNNDYDDDMPSAEEDTTFNDEQDNEKEYDLSRISMTI